MDTGARIEAAKARLAEQQAILIRSREAPVCAKCKYFQMAGRSPKSGEVFTKSWTYCGHPAYERHAYNHSFGRVLVEAPTLTDTARSEDGLCGPEGLLYEHRPDRTLIAIGGVVFGLPAVSLGCLWLASLFS